MDIDSLRIKPDAIIGKHFIEMDRVRMDKPSRNQGFLFEKLTQTHLWLVVSTSESTNQSLINGLSFPF